MSVSEVPIVLENIPKTGRLLEIGSHPFEITKMLKDKGYDIHGIDLIYSRKDLNVVKCDIEIQELPYKDNEFDIVLLMQVIEHLSKPIFALKEIKRVLKPKGIFVLTTPNFFSLNNIKSLFFKRKQNDFGSLLEDENYAGHIRVYTKNELKELLEHCGLIVQNMLFLHHRDYMLFVVKKNK